MGPEPVDYVEPESTYLRKAGEAAFWPALRQGGWTDEQIHNGLRTHRASILDEIAELVHNVGDRMYDDRGLKAAEAVWATADELKALALQTRAERTY